MTTGRATVPHPRDDKFIRRTLTPTALVDALRAEILDGTLPLGSRLAEADLAETRGLSRHTIKLALTEMAELGLVVQRPHKGTWVREMSDADITDLYWVRWVIESEATTQAAMDSGSWDALEASVRVLETLAPGTPWSVVADADWAFHRAIVASTGSEHLLSAHHALKAETLLSFVQSRPEDDVVSVGYAHRALLDAIRSGDPDDAKRSLRDHLEESRHSLLAARRQARADDA